MFLQLHTGPEVFGERHRDRKVNVSRQH